MMLRWAKYIALTTIGVVLLYAVFPVFINSLASHHKHNLESLIIFILAALISVFGKLLIIDKAIKRFPQNAWLKSGLVALIDTVAVVLYYSVQGIEFKLGSLLFVLLINLLYIGTIKENSKSILHFENLIYAIVMGIVTLLFFIVATFFVAMAGFSLF